MSTESEARVVTEAVTLTLPPELAELVRDGRVKARLVIDHRKRRRVGRGVQINARVSEAAREALYSIAKDRNMSASAVIEGLIQTAAAGVPATAPERE